MSIEKWDEEVDEDEHPSPTQAMEQAIEDCGLDEDERRCALAGTEYCQYHCPLAP